ncbi:unnamed protein product, partial [Pocillopora meandrina]
VSLIEDDEETNNEGSSCQQEAMEDESATLPSREINEVAPNQHLNSFNLRNVSMAAKDRVHDFALDLANTTSSQPDTSSHLNQSKSPASESAIFLEFGPDPVNEESFSYPERVSMLSPMYHGKLISNLLIHNLAEISAPQVNASQEMGDVDMEKAKENYKTTGDSWANSHVSLTEDDEETNNEGSSCQQEAMEDESATLPSSEINAVAPDQHLNSFPSPDVSMLAKKRENDSSETTMMSSDVPHVCASPVWEIHETGCPPSSSAQTPVTHSWSSTLTSGRSIDIGLKTTCATPAENKTPGETAATSSDGSIITDLNTTDMPSFRCKSGTSAKKESCDFGTSATSSDVDANQVITKSSRFADIFSPSLNEFKEQESTGDSLSHSRVSLRIDEVEARQNSSACVRRSESPSKNTQSHDKGSVNPLTNSLGLKQSDFENTSIISCCCDGKAYIENEASPSCSKSFGFVAKMSTGLENSNLVSKRSKRKRKRGAPECSNVESVEPLRKSPRFAMETGENQTESPLIKVKIEHQHPPAEDLGDPTDAATSAKKRSSPKAKGKTRKRKRSVRESSDISDKPLQNFPWLETNEPQVVSPQAEGEKEQPRVKVEVPQSPEALEYAHFCLRNAYHALLGATAKNVTIQPQVNTA